MRVVLAERGVDRVVRAGLAERRRPPLRQLRLGRGVAGEDTAHARDGELAEAEGLRLRLHGDAGGADRVGEERVALLDHDAALDRPREGADLLERERVDRLQLEEARLRRRLARVARGDAGGHDPELPVGPRLHVERRRLGPRGEARELLAELLVRGAGVGRDHHAARDVAPEGGRPRRERRPPRHDRLRVADAGRHPEDHRELPALRELERGEREVVGLLRVGRLEHRQPGRHRVVAVVLLVLATTPCRGRRRRPRRARPRRRCRRP